MSLPPPSYPQTAAVGVGCIATICGGPCLRALWQRLQASWPHQRLLLVPRPLLLFGLWGPELQSSTD
eukprot:3675130-Alexandrium_andersonii.AAC.1